MWLIMELVSVGWGADAIAALASSCSECGSKMYHLSCGINFAGLSVVGLYGLTGRFFYLDGI